MNTVLVARDATSLDNRSIAHAVRNHGGILGAIEYGLKAEEIADPELANAWRQLESDYAAIRPTLTVIGRVLAKSFRR